MTQHNEEDPAITSFWALDPGRFQEIEQVQVQQIIDIDTIGMVLKIVARESHPDTQERLILEFDGISNLHMAPLEGLRIPFDKLRITSIKHFQWAGLLYEVEEAEHDTMSFLCYDFRASVIGAEMLDRARVSWTQRVF